MPHLLPGDPGVLTMMMVTPRWKASSVSRKQHLCHLRDPSPSLHAACRARLDLCPPITGGKGQRASLLPCAECRTQRSHYASLNRRLCLAAIILFSAADVSPPFLYWEYSAAFSSAGRAMSERNDTPRSSDPGNTWKGSGDMAWRKPERWEEEGQASMHQSAYFNGWFLQVCT